MSDGWIEWSGGKCPVAEGTIVEIRTRNGWECLTKDPRTYHRWEHADRLVLQPYDIVAYRILKPVILR